MARENEGLQQLGKKTEYKMTYAPEVLETFENKHKDNDSLSSPRCAPLPVSQTSQKSRLCIFLAKEWWSRRA